MADDDWPAQVAALAELLLIVAPGLCVVPFRDCYVLQVLGPDRGRLVIEALRRLDEPTQTDDLTF